MPPGVTEKKKFAFAYGSTKAWKAISASSSCIGSRCDPGNSNGLLRPALPMKFAMTDVSGLKTFDAPGLRMLLIVWTSVIAVAGCSFVGFAQRGSVGSGVTTPILVRSFLAGGCG